MTVVKLSRLGSAEAFAARLAELQTALSFDETLDAAGPLAQPLDSQLGRIGNRFAILPMEGWDATPEGAPTDLVERRWTRFGESGAKLVWGGEAVAVRHDGRANPRQLVMSDASARGIERLRERLVSAHEAAHGSSADLRVGLQLTHSGRFARPDGTPRPRVAQRHPLLDPRVGVDGDAAVLSDAELDDLVGCFAEAARRARELGFDFVDFKHCHGYLGHELLSARNRPGPYGGDFAGRTRFFERGVAAIRQEAPGLAIAVRLSVFDFSPYRPGPDGSGTPEEPAGPTPFGGGRDGTSLDLAETNALLERFAGLGIEWVCTTAGSPYYNPHIQRPALLPPSDGYAPPEDPLVGVARQIFATAELARRHPQLHFVGSAYTYLQEWLPRVAQRQVRDGAVDVVGLGRMALSYPTLPADVLAGRPLRRGAICRTFSDCTTAPRAGMISGCYPLDPFYKRRDEARRLRELKRGRGR